MFRTGRTVEPAEKNGGGGRKSIGQSENSRTMRRLRWFVARMRTDRHSFQCVAVATSRSVFQRNRHRCEGVDTTADKSCGYIVTEPPVVSIAPGLSGVASPMTPQTAILRTGHRRPGAGFTRQLPRTNSILHDERLRLARRRGFVFMRRQRLDGPGRGLAPARFRALEQTPNVPAVLPDDHG